MMAYIHSVFKKRRSKNTRMDDKGKITLIQKHLQKGTIPSNYKPITCGPLMSRILTIQIRKEIYNLLLCYELFPRKRPPEGMAIEKEGLVTYFSLINISLRREK